MSDTHDLIEEVVDLELLDDLLAVCESLKSPALEGILGRVRVSGLRSRMKRRIREKRQALVFSEEE